MIYLDNSATTRTFDSVIEAMDACMREDYFNVSAAYAPAMLAEQAVDRVRAQVRDSLGVPHGRVIFTGGGSESDNLAILGTAETLHSPRTFLVGQIEHPAVLETLRRVERMGHRVQTLPILPDGRIDADTGVSMVNEETAMVLCMHVNNETGAVQPLEALAKGAKQKNPDCLMFCDGVQGYLRVPVRLREAGIDFYTISAHKFHGPKGVGALVSAKDLRLMPQITGGGQEGGLRSGTLNSPGIRGMGEAIRAYTETDWPSRLYDLKVELVRLLSAEEGIFFNGPDPLDRELSAPHILSVRFEGVRGEVMRNALEGMGILVSTGSACGSHKQKVSQSLSEMGLSREQADGTVRVSLGAYNTKEEIEQTAEAMISQARLLRKFRRR